MKAAVLFAWCAACLPAIARADAPPLRHLVYSYTYQSNQRGAVPNDPGSTGARTYSGALGDHGTIAVDVLREAPDRGLVVIVSEQGTATRSATPATCAVYGNTSVVCEPGKTVNSEEYTLLRFLGANFIDASRVDANNHWSTSENGKDLVVKGDYVITSNNNGQMTIDETRHVDDRALGDVTTDVQTKLDYNATRLLPTKIDEYATEHRNAGIQGISTTTVQTTLTLVSDSMAK
jgi:hypothetical protein